MGMMAIGSGLSWFWGNTASWWMLWWQGIGTGLWIEQRGGDGDDCGRGELQLRLQIWNVMDCFQWW
jgi:hypothetical protein